MGKMNAYRRYLDFWGRFPRKAFRRFFHSPQTLVLLGDAIYIEYVSDKFNGGGDGEPAIYCHKLSRGAKLYMDEKAGKQLYIMSPRVYVDARGVVN
jgi:hypothetical protein